MTFRETQIIPSFWVEFDAYAVSRVCIECVNEFQIRVAAKEETDMIIKKTKLSKFAMDSLNFPFKYTGVFFLPQNIYTSMSIS